MRILWDLIQVSQIIVMALIENIPKKYESGGTTPLHMFGQMK
jgi:hypothetical protein